MNPVLSLVVASVACWNPGTANRVDFQKALSGAKPPALLLIAQKYGDEDPHGPDPHGDDPHDEYHDKGLPANKEQKKNKAPKDVYGGGVYNDKDPYPPDAYN